MPNLRLRLPDQQWRSCETEHISRRNFIKRACVLSIGVPAISAILADCGGSAPSGATPSSGITSAAARTSASDRNTTPTSTAAGQVTTPAGTFVRQVSTPASTSVSQIATPTTTAVSQVTHGTNGNKYGGTVTLARTVDSDDLDPGLDLGDIDGWVLSNIYDTLVTVADNGRDLVPGLAEKWETSSDGLKYTFHIRQGVKFSDGSALAVSDVIWSLNRVKDSTVNPFSSSLEPVSEFSSPNESTVVATLNQISAPFLAEMAILSSVVSEEFASNNSLQDQCMGTGPFALKEWVQGQHLTLVKNEHYWEPGLPYLDQITLVVVADTNDQVHQLESGQVDGIVYGVEFSQLAALAKNSTIDVIQSPSAESNFITLNTLKAPLNDVKVRQALNYATDKHMLNQEVLLGNGQICNSLIPNGALYWNPNQKGYPFDLAQARSLIKASSVPNGFGLQLNVTAGDQQQLQTAMIIKNMWEKIDVSVTINSVGPNDHPFVTGDFQAILTSWTNDCNDPDEIMTYTILPGISGNFYTHWNNQQAIDLVSQGRSTLDPSRRRQIYYQLQAMHMEAAPFVYLYLTPYLDAVNKKVKDYFHHPMGQYVFKNMYLES